VKKKNKVLGRTHRKKETHRINHTSRHKKRQRCTDWGKGGQIHTQEPACGTMVRGAWRLSARACAYRGSQKNETKSKKKEKQGTDKKALTANMELSMTRTMHQSGWALVTKDDTGPLRTAWARRRILLLG